MGGPAPPVPFWLIGCGNMAGAMLDRWLAAGLDRAGIVVVRPSGRPIAEGVRVMTALPEEGPPALVLLGIKPQTLDAVAPALAARLEGDTVLLSILAGVELRSLRARFPAPRTIIRVMPNLPVRLGKGVVALCGEGADAAARESVGGLMAALGTAEWFEDEERFALAGHLAGAGPAFLFRFIDALSAAGESLGLPAAQADRLARAMVEGAAALAAAGPESPAALAARVASPRGTTEAGLRVLDDRGALKALVRRTLEASRRRGLELAQEARAGN